MTMAPGRETLYWLILGAVVVTFALWITQLQSDINALYDQIDSANAESTILDMTLEKDSKKPAAKQTHH